MKKYELTNETITIGNTKTLYRIRALINIEEFEVKIGDLGGYIETEKNLSHYGNAWVYGNAMVYGNAWVYGDARVYGNAWVYGDARIFDNAIVFDNARVFGHAEVFGHARIFDNAIDFDNAEVYGDARVYDNARVFGNAGVFGHARVCGYVVIGGDAGVGGDAEINKSSHILTIGPIGSRNDTTTFFRTKENIIKVVCGCFYGTIDDFLAKVELTHGDNKNGHVYRIAAELAKSQIELD